MTSAPKNLLAVRSLLLTHLDNAPGPDDLDAAEVGIVGDSAHRGGYHCGRDRVDLDDYSVDESPRDRAGLGDFASALDVGAFSYRDALGRTHNLQTFSKWLVVECEGNAPDTRDIREVIYSPDGKTVKRWDRLRKRSSGDSSHRWHTHLSFFRDATKSGRDLTGVFRRYLTVIGRIKPATPEDPDMAFDTEQAARAWATTKRAEALMAGVDAVYRIPGETADRTEPNVMARTLKRIESQLSAPAPVTVDPATLAAALAEPSFLAALAKAVNDDAARRLVA